VFEDSPFKNFDEAMTKAGFEQPPVNKESQQTGFHPKKLKSTKKESI